MGLKRRMMLYLMGTLATGVVVSLAINVGLLLAAFPGWVENVETSMVNAEQQNLLRIAVGCVMPPPRQAHKRHVRLGSHVRVLGGRARTQASKGDFTNEFFSRIAQQTRLLDVYTEGVMGGDIVATPATTTYQVSGTYHAATSCCLAAPSNQHTAGEYQRMRRSRKPRIGISTRAATRSWLGGGNAQLTHPWPSRAKVCRPPRNSVRRPSGASTRPMLSSWPCMRCLHLDSL